MRESDILLSLMLSPHPSYPPLEMAASGGLVVTTSYEGKSARQLASLSANIVATEPTLEAITAGLATFVRVCRTGQHDKRGACQPSTNVERQPRGSRTGAGHSPAGTTGKPAAFAGRIAER